MTIEVLEGLKRKLNIVIPKEVVTQLAKTKLRSYAKTASIAGFRKGKVPEKILEQAYGNSAYEDALNDKLHEEFTKSITDNKLDPVGEPKFDLLNKDNVDTEFLFTVTFEIMPEVHINDLTKLIIKKPECEFQEHMIEDTIALLRKRQGEFIVINTNAKTGDRVTIDFVGKVEDQEFAGGSANDYQFILGEQKMLPEFENGILGLNTSDTKNIIVHFPENYHNQDLKSKEAVFTITVKKIEELKMADLDSEFVKSLGVNDGNVETLKQELHKEIKKELKKRLTAITRNNIFNALLENNVFDVPYTLVHDEIHHMMDNAAQNMREQGYPDDKIKLTHDMFKVDATRFVKLRLIMRALIAEYDLKVNSSDTDAIINELSGMYADPVEYVKWYKEDSKRLDSAKAMALEEKIVSLILEKGQLQTEIVDYDTLLKMAV